MLTAPTSHRAAAPSQRCQRSVWSEAECSLPVGSRSSSRILEQRARARYVSTFERTASALWERSDVRVLGCGLVVGMLVVASVLCGACEPLIGADFDVKRVSC